MGQVRIEKMQELIGQEVSKMLMKDVKNPKIGFVTVTGVKMTGDLRTAKIFVSVLGDDKNISETFTALKHSLLVIESDSDTRRNFLSSSTILLQKIDELMNCFIRSSRRADRIEYHVERNGR